MQRVTPAAPSRGCRAAGRSAPARRRASRTWPPRLRHHLEHLLVLTAHRDEHPAASASCSTSGCGMRGAAGAHEDRVVRRVLAPARRCRRRAAARRSSRRRAAIALARHAEQRRDALDREDLLDEVREQHGLVPGAGADLQHALRALELEQLAGSARGPTAARSSGRCRSGAAHPRTRDGARRWARTRGAASGRTRAARRGRGCPSRAASRRAGGARRASRPSTGPATRLSADSSMP